MKDVFISRDAKERETNSQETLSTVEVQGDWILYDFNNARKFERTIPIYCKINDYVVTGKNWNRILVAIIEYELQNNNSRLEALYNEPLTPKRGNSPFFLKEKIERLHCSELSNGYWINANWNIPQMVNLIGSFCLYCGYSKEQVALCGISKETAQREVASVEKETLGSRSIPKILLESIRQYYPNGLRFDGTVLRLLEEYSGCEISKEIQMQLQEFMFKRCDGLYLLPEMIVNTGQTCLQQDDSILEMLDIYGCIAVNVLYKNYIDSGDSSCLRNENDFADYLMFSMPNDIRIGNILNNKIVRRIGVPLNDAAQKAANMVVKTIKENGCMTQEDILNTYPMFSESFLGKLLEKYTDEIFVTKINDYLCYQTIESLGIDSDFSLNLHDVIEETKRLSLMPSQDVIHALLSVRLGYNVWEELGILDDRTFRRIISLYYTDERRRTWKAGSFVEMEMDYVQL